MRPEDVDDAVERAREAHVRGAGGLVQILREAGRALGPGRRRIPVLGGAALVAAVLETALLYLVARLATSLTLGQQRVVVGVGPLSTPPLAVSTLTATAGALLVVLVAISLPVARLAASLSELAITRCRRRLLRAYLATPWSLRSAEPEGMLQDLLGEYASRTEFLVRQVSTIVVSAGSLVILLAATIAVAPVAAALAIAGVVLAGLSLRPLAGRVQRQTGRYAAATNTFASRAAQTSRLAQEIAAYDVGDRVAAEMDEQIRTSGGLLRQVRFINVLSPALYQYAALAIVIVIIAVLNALRPGDLAPAAPVLLLLIRALGYGRLLESAIQTGHEYVPYLTALEEQVERLERSIDEPGTHRIDHLGCVSFRKVSFAYLPGIEVLHEIDLAIAPGAAIGVVGPSGGGKSTLVQLLLGLLRPSSGTIEVDGHRLDDIDRRRWSELVAFVPQDNKLVHGTVADNIRFYRATITGAEVEAAARAAHLHDEVMALPDGYATVVGPGARELSGGQRQRLGIARALAGAPELLVLDEPTSALDRRSEELIRQTLQERPGSVSLLIVAHRPATLALCERVVRLDHGVLHTAEPDGSPRPDEDWGAGEESRARAAVPDPHR